MSYPGYYSPYSYNGPQQGQNLVSVAQILATQQNPGQPFYQTPQQVTANNLFNTGPGYTKEVIFTSPTGQTTVYQNSYPQGGYGGF